MRPSKAMTVCAVSVLAMVFSVQQGEYGPLVVYKLQVPKATAPAMPAPALPATAPPAALPATVIIEDPVAAVPRVGPLQPTILGTVVMPASRQAPAPAGQTFGGIPLRTPVSAPDGMPDSARVYRIVEDFDGNNAMINEETGDTLTLQDVNEAIAWRRDTVGKLRQVPIAPRF